MDKDFSISGYLLSRLQPDDPQEARLRMLCVTISKDMPEERRERQLRPFASDMEFMNMIAGWMNGLPEAISHEQPDFERWLELFMTAGEAESTRYVMRLQIWYTHYCCVEELLTLCRLLQRHREEHLEAIYHRMLYYFREARIQCGMPSTSEPAEGIEVSFKLLDASYEHINRKIILQAEELLGIHTDHSFIQKVMECHTEAKTAEELAGYGFQNIPKEYQTNTHLIYSSPATLAFNSPGAEGFGVKRAGLSIPDSVMLLVSPGCCGRNTTGLGNVEEYQGRVFYLEMEENDLVTGKHLKKFHRQ